MKRDVTGSEIHGRSDAKLEGAIKAQLTQHTHIETVIPTVLVAGDHILLLGAIGIGNEL